MADTDDHSDSTDTADVAAPSGARRQYLIIVVLAVLVIALDQLSKVWAINTLSDGPIPVVWTLQLNLVTNTGAAFSLGRGNELMRFLPLVVLGVVGYLVWQGRQAMTRLGGIAIGMILGGAIGNLIDRALRSDGGAFFSGGVIDFIDFGWWPVFNVADMGVVLGGLLLVAVSLRSDRRPGHAGGSAPSSDTGQAGSGGPAGHDETDEAAT